MALTEIQDGYIYGDERIELTSKKLIKFVEVNYHKQINVTEKEILMMKCR